MHQGSLRERLCGDAGTAAEFDGQGRSTSAMGLFGGRVEGHLVNTIWRYGRFRVKVQNAL